MAHLIRKLKASDFDSLTRVWAQSGLSYRPVGRDSREAVETQMKRDDTAFYGLFEDGYLLAVGLATYEGRKGWINRVAVDPDRRGEGLGGEIIKTCEEFLRRCGATIIACLIEDWNSPSISLFQKHGYEALEGILYFSKRDSEDV